jgi:hypothetical protein
MPASGVVAAAAGPGVGVFPALVLVVVMAAVHVVGGRFRALEGIPRSRWLSFGAGVSVAYVFVHLLPELQAGAETFREGVVPGFLEHHVYLVALCGFSTFYGVERLVTHGKRNAEPFGLRLPDDAVFWSHVALFTVYNALVGYLVHERGSLLAAATFAVAMGLHFLVNDVDLRETHEAAYDEVGRWLLAGGTLVGGALGVVGELPELLVVATLAFVGGATVLNVVKEELPDERESRFWAFGVGVVGYTLLLLSV